LLDYLIEQRIETNSGVAWGYNFDWQNRAFLAPSGTPTIVPTAFAVRALTEAATAFGEQGYLELATRACSFITSALNVTDESDDEICWSYSPLDRTRVLNASLLAAESLATVGKLTSNAAFLDLALRGARYVARRQQPDGSWAYGAEGFQGWVDNFHTAFVLTSLHRIATACDADAELRPAIERGYEFWSTRFFRSDGWPKYYPDSDYPADAHSSGAALVALAELRSVDPGSNELARRIANWTIVNLQDKDGYFYYQRKRFYVNRVAYMRWSQAWMFYGLARFLEVERSESGTEAGSRKDIGHPEDRV
jgi:hypothetical protein